MSVWYCIPSARPREEAEKCLRAWRQRGYRVAVFVDDIHCPVLPGAEVVIGFPQYPGYATAVNRMAEHVLEIDPSCNWIVTGGDDVWPDPNHTADEIAAQCEAHFGGDSFGVMQPTGDRFAYGSIDRIAGSPWMGRKWCLLANQGKGPLWHEFTHMYVDECLQRTAEKLGVYWQRPELIHMHRHYARAHDGVDSPARHAPPPPHLEKWNTREHWNEMRAIFKRLEAEDFKSCLPL